MKTVSVQSLYEELIQRRKNALIRLCLQKGVNIYKNPKTYYNHAKANPGCDSHLEIRRDNFFDQIEALRKVGYVEGDRLRVKRMPRSNQGKGIKRRSAETQSDSSPIVEENYGTSEKSELVGKDTNSDFFELRPEAYVFASGLFDVEEFPNLTHKVENIKYTILP